MVKNLSAKAGVIRGLGLIPGSGRSPGGGHDNPLQYSCLENPMDRGAWGLQSMGLKRVGRVQLCAYPCFSKVGPLRNFIS